MSNTYIDLKTLQLQLQHFQSLCFHEKLSSEEVSTKYFNFTFIIYTCVSTNQWQTVITPTFFCCPFLPTFNSPDKLACYTWFCYIIFFTLYYYTLYTALQHLICYILLLLCLLLYLYMQHYNITLHIATMNCIIYTDSQRCP